MTTLQLRRLKAGHVPRQCKETLTVTTDSEQNKYTK